MEIRATREEAEDSEATKATRAEVDMEATKATKEEEVEEVISWATSCREWAWAEEDREDTAKEARADMAVRVDMEDREAMEDKEDKEADTAARGTDREACKVGMGRDSPTAGGWEP